MAEKLKQKNLRSLKSKDRTYLPVWYQMCNDNQVQHKMLENQTNPGGDSLDSHYSDTNIDVSDKCYSDEEPPMISDKKL